MHRRQFLAVSGPGIVLQWRWFDREPEIAGIRFREVHTGAGRHYIWLHGNEQTAREVLEEHMKAANGRALFVRSTDRYVSLFGGRVDPNRIWSREGAGQNLKTLNPSWTAQELARALGAIEDDRPAFLKGLLPRQGRVLVALHNNGPAYSVSDEVPISDSIALNDREHPDEFMLCTIPTDFELLSGGPYNVVLQHRAPKQDDGSLSRLCAARGIRYVNIEAALGNAGAQRKMLDWVERML